MKRCPKCFRFYSDETLNYCLEDGANLEKEKNASLETSPTEIFGQDEQQTEIIFSPPISSSEAINSLAILPLVNKNSDPDIEYLSDGITESIIYSLSRLPKLRVMAYSTISRFKGQQTDPIKIGRELRVRAVLAGRLLQFQDTLTICTELVDTRNGAQLRGEQFRRPVSDILTVQEEISGKVIENLRLKLSDEEEGLVKKQPTEKTEAYYLYLKGRYYWNKFTAQDFEKAISYFSQAIEKDPNYALAYVGLSDTYRAFSTYYLPPKECMPKAKEAILKALEIDNTLAEAHGSLGMLKLQYDWDGISAEREFKLAIELDPNYLYGQRLYSNYLLVTAQFEESIAETQQALKIDPFSLPGNLGLGWRYYFARQYDNAIKHLQEMLQTDMACFSTYFVLGLAYLQKEMFQEAVFEFQKAKNLDDTWTTATTMLCYTYGITNESSKAKMLRQELKKQAKKRYVPAGEIALTHLGLDEKEQVFEWLEKAVNDRDYGMVFLQIEPLWDGVRCDPRFAVLLKSVGLTNAKYVSAQAI